jgi:hypothetical protein
MALPTSMSSMLGDQRPWTRSPAATVRMRTAKDCPTDDERRAAIEKAIVEGYRRYPPEQPSAADFQRADRSISAEPW